MKWIFFLALAGCADVWGFESGELSKDANSSLDPSSSAGSSTTSSSAGTGGNASCDGDQCTDSKNCGMTGHDCLGGECKDGICQPVLLISENAAKYFDIKATNGTIYWSKEIIVSITEHLYDFSISKCNTDACLGSMTDVIVNETARSISYYNSNLYWSDYFNGAFWCLSSTCESTKSTIDTTLHESKIASDGSYLYWGDDKTIGRCLIANCQNTMVTMYSIQEPSNNTDGMYIDGGDLFWTNDYGDVNTCTILNCAATEHHLIKGDATRATAGIAVDGTVLYWSENDGVFSCNKTDCMNTVHNVVSAFQAGQIAIDSKSIYVIGTTTKSSYEGIYRIVR